VAAQPHALPARRRPAGAGAGTALLKGSVSTVIAIASAARLGETLAGLFLA
jgi:hypothetical protein